MSIRWQIQLFGGLCLRQQDASTLSVPEVRIESRKAASLLAILAYHRGRSFPRDLLAEQIWPGEDIDPVRDRFRQALSVLKRTLEGGETESGRILFADRMEVRLNPVVAQTDVADFLQHAQTANQPDISSTARTDSLIQAVNLYQGELLAGFYDDWIFPERTQLTQKYQGICTRLALRMAEDGLWDEALMYSQRAVQTEMGREDLQGVLMRLYVAAGRRPEAMRQFAELERVLRKESLTPSEETKNLIAFLQKCGPGNALDGLRVPDNYSKKLHSGSATPLTQPVSTTSRVASSLEPDGGAVPLESPFYVERPQDSAFFDAISRQDSIVLVKGPRLIGKTSLLARGFQRSRSRADTSAKPAPRIVLTDFQKLTAEQLQSPDTLFFTLAETISDRLNLDVSVESLWNPARGWNVNFERFLRRTVFGSSDASLIWGLDEVDRLFSYSYRSEVFGLFRSWHNERALDPDGPWSRLTLAIAYATEAHLFITDLNQSPFNVGTRLLLEDFSYEDTRELNRRYGLPLANDANCQRFYSLVGGHPYLQRRGLRALAEKELTLSLLESEGDRDDGVYGDHLLRLLSVLRNEPDLYESVRRVLGGSKSLSVDAFYRLRSAGVIVGASPQDSRLRCELYRRFLQSRLPL